jgi:hypothetical protein
VLKSTNGHFALLKSTEVTAPRLSSPQPLRGRFATASERRPPSVAAFGRRLSIVDYGGRCRSRWRRPPMAAYGALRQSSRPSAAVDRDLRPHRSRPLAAVDHGFRSPSVAALGRRRHRSSRPSAVVNQVSLRFKPRQWNGHGGWWWSLVFQSTEAFCRSMTPSLSGAKLFSKFMTSDDAVTFDIKRN